MILISLISIAVLVGADQLIKVWIQGNMSPGGAAVPFIRLFNRDIISLTYHENTGAAFSMLSGKLPFLIIITSIFVLFGIYLVVSKRVRHPMTVVGISLMIAGGLGNLIDRIFRGYVIDYLEVRIFNFAIFNFADCCVVVGAVILMVAVLFFDQAFLSSKSSKSSKWGKYR